MDLYYQHCEGLNLDEDTLRNNISILNNKIDSYNNLSKPNKRLVNNATLQLDRNQELLDGLYYVSNNTTTLLDSSPSNEYTNYDNYVIGEIFFQTITRFPMLYAFRFGIVMLFEANSKLSYKDLINNFTSWVRTNSFGKCFKILGWTGDIIVIASDVIYDINHLDFQNQPINSTVKMVSHASIDVGVTAGATAVGAVIGSIIPGVGTTVGAVVGFVSGVVIDVGANLNFPNGKSVVDYTKDFMDWIIDFWVPGV